MEEIQQKFEFTIKSLNCIILSLYEIIKLSFSHLFKAIKFNKHQKLHVKTSVNIPCSFVVEGVRPRLLTSVFSWTGNILQRIVFWRACTGCSLYVRIVQCQLAWPGCWRMKHGRVVRARQLSRRTRGTRSTNVSAVCGNEKLEVQIHL